MKIIILTLFLYFFYSIESAYTYKESIIEDILSLPIKKYKLNRQNKINLAKYFVKFASFGYCSSKEIKRNNCCQRIFPNRIGEKNKEKWELIDYDEETFFYDNENNYSILRNDKYKKVAIVFPGTKNYTQILKEVALSKLFNFFESDEKILINFYFGSRAKSLLEKIFKPKNINRMKLSENYQIFFIGHSLGGAVASSLCAFALESKYISKKMNSPIIITYGQPRVGNSNLKKYIEKNTETIIRIVNRGDVVPCVPFCDPIIKKGNIKCINKGINSYEQIGEEIMLDVEENIYRKILGVIVEQNIDVCKENKYKKDLYPNFTGSLGELGLYALTGGIEKHTKYLDVYVGTHCKNNNINEKVSDL